jgi:hypothetical protein
VVHDALGRWRSVGAGSEMHDRINTGKSRPPIGGGSNRTNDRSLAGEG